MADQLDPAASGDTADPADLAQLAPPPAVAAAQAGAPPDVFDAIGVIAADDPEMARVLSWLVANVGATNAAVTTFTAAADGFMARFSESRMAGMFAGLFASNGAD